MKTRAITGFIFAVIVLGLILFDGYSFSIFFVLISYICTLEFYNLVKTDDVKPNKFIGLLFLTSIIVPLLAHFLANQSINYLLLSIPFGVLVIVSELYKHHKNPFHNISYNFLAIIYAAIPFCFFYAMAFRDGQYSYHYPFAFLMMLWSSDTGAYVFGVNFGKHRLFERHSPKKSWEGFVGGLICSMIAAFVLSIYFTELSFINWLIIAAIIATTGTLGDLSESMLKRSLSTKDSGNFLPGHGGFLDRFDGLLIAAPLVYVYLCFLGM
jgi:phosphatidate cytidylyltransferase